MRIFRAIPLILTLLIIYGMSEPQQIPPELRKVRAKVTDAKGVVHELVSFRCNEGATLKFRRGNLDYTLSLSSIKSIEVLGSEDGYVKVLVKLREGKEERFEIPSSTRCSAESEVGNVSFYINEVRKIELIQGESR